jgi:diaminopimelate epimerase
MRLPFTKMQGAGNDFVVLDGTAASIELSRAQLMRLGDRRFGVGADQILAVERSSTPGIDFRYRIYNGASGDEVEHCGNGARCFLRYVHERGLTDKRRVRVATVNNVLELELREDGRVAVDMNRPVFDLAALPFEPGALVPQRTGGQDFWPIAGVPVAVLGMGNPHAVQRVDDVATAPVAALGPRIEADEHFPRKVNAGFMQETLACGTGACAAVVAGVRAGWLARAVEVHTRGGALLIEWPHDDAHVQMTGPAETVFRGEIEL